jgi:hypothetical protein
MSEKSNQSLFDVLVRLMPELRLVRKQKTDPKLANMLYNQIWSNEQRRVANKTYRRPDDMKLSDVNRLASEGLVSVTGENIEITEKGAGVIKQMILGDERSVFDDDGSPAEYLKSLANLEPARLNKSSKRASTDDAPKIRGKNWYTVMMDQHATCADCCRRKA